MKYLKCNHCENFNQVKTQYLTFCTYCNKKLDNSFGEWQKRNSGKSFEKFLNQVCVTEEETRIKIVAKKPKTRKGLKYTIGFLIAFSIFYIAGHYGGKEIINYVKNIFYNRAMMEVASNINESCPIMVDSETRLDNTVALPGNIFQYNYTLINTELESVDVDLAKKQLEPTIINFIKTSPEMKFQRDYKAIINYSYKDKTGKHIMTISVTPDKYL